MSQFADAVKSLVSADRLKLALVVLADYWKDKSTEQHNQCVLLQSTLTQVEKEYSLGIVTRSEAGQSLAKIRYTTLRLADEANEALKDDAAACRRAATLQQSFSEPEFAVKPRTRPAWFLWAAGAGVSGIAVLYYFLGGSPVKDVDTTAVPARTIAPIDTAVIVEALINEAEQYYDQNSFAQALQSANRAIALRPDRGTLYNTRASIYFKQGNIELAAADARRAVVLSPDDCLGYATLAQVCTKQNDTEGFYQNIEISLKKRCKVWRFVQQAGIVEHSAEKRFQDLIAAYQAAQ
ncbi:MAG: hypothetical protein ACKVUS_01745 [Saprospiraceae bacterium]